MAVQVTAHYDQAIVIPFISEFYLFLSKVNCSWATWSAWGSCDVTCGGGTQGRTREVATPAENGGSACNPVDSKETRNCNTDCCPGKVEYFLQKGFGDI